MPSNPPPVKPPPAVDLGAVLAALHDVRDAMKACRPMAKLLLPGEAAEQALRASQELERTHRELLAASGPKSEAEPGPDLAVFPLERRPDHAR